MDEPDAPIQPTTIPEPGSDDQIPEEIVSQGVRGWLWFFCFSLTVVRPMALLVTAHLVLRESATDLDQAANLPPWPTIVALLPTGISLLFPLGLAVLSLYAGLLLWQVRPGAVKAAKRFLWGALAYSVLIAIMTLLAEPPADSETSPLVQALGHLFRGVLSFSLWYAYLLSSKRVRATYTS